MSGQTSGCPSVMTLTPAAVIAGDSGPPSNVSTPAVKTPVKTELAPATPGMSQKKRLLAKAQSEWILIDPKPEPEVEVEKRYGSYEYLDRSRERTNKYEAEIRERERLRADREREERARLEREERARADRERERVRQERDREDRLRIDRERERIERDERLQRERLERERAEYDYQTVALAAARERDLREQLAGVVPRLELAPPLAHQAEYGDLHRGAAVEYIQPPAAHSNRDLLAVHRSAQHFAHSSPAHESLYAPATVYVTAAGYQQIAFPPPAHHARPVIPPTMQSAAVFHHPQLHPQYGYDPLSPGKTRYLY